MTATSDARACAPLEKGGFAFATGGGLVITRPDGTSTTLTSLDGLANGVDPIVQYALGAVDRFLWCWCRSHDSIVRSRVVYVDVSRRLKSIVAAEPRPLPSADVSNPESSPRRSKLKT